jgi:protein TonB
MSWIPVSSRLVAVGIHVAGIGIAMSMPSSPPPPKPRDIPITLSIAPPAPPAPKVVEKVEEPKPVTKPKAKPKPIVEDIPPPPVPQPVAPPAPAVIASAATSVAEAVTAPPEVVAPPPPPPPSPSPGDLRAKQDYFARLLAWLERHKRYPGEARSRRNEGTVMVRFTMDRTGRVQSFALDRTSGSPVLDTAALKMVERASPLPSMPKEMPDQQLELVVPVEFYIR